MKILCIDTSNNLCSVAILENINLIDKIELDSGLTHSETLMPIIQNILSKNNITLKDIDLLVSNIGPGSFTGLRIGISTCKAFSDSLKIPCIGISSLEVLAYNIKKSGIICSTIDCKNDNCYFALYELVNDTYNVLETPRAYSTTEVIDLLKNKYSNDSINFIGNGIPSKCTDCYLNVENLGIAGYKKFINNNYIGEEILPLYLKKPQAEKQLEKKQLEKKLTTNLKIEKMTLKDLNSIKNILPTEFDDFWTYSTFMEELKCENSYFVAAKNANNEIIGFAVLKIILDEADIMNIVVKKNYRHMGIGSIILEHLINYAKSLHLNTIHLEVNEKNLSAIHLYDKFKFEHISIRKKYYNGKSDAIIMSKKINSKMGTR